MALVLLDAVTVATFARCFAGPGELALAIPVCIGAHLLAHLGRALRRRRQPAAGIGLWVLTLLLVAYIPLGAVDGGSFRFGLLPLSATQHLLGQQLHAAWLIFSNRTAPVSQAPGLVLAAAWAAGVLALAAEALDADTTLPAVVALVPAFDIVVFTGTLGTATGRAPELAALAALAVWYLAGANRHAAGEQVVTARLEGSPQVVATEGGRSGRSGRRVPSAAAGLALVAGISAGVIGPLLPGATSTALLAWHGTGKPSSQNKGGRPGFGGGPIAISNLVQVGEAEIHNTNTPFFRVYGTSPTRETLFVLDEFTGSEWLEAPSSLRTPVAPFSGSIEGLEAHPEKPLLDENREEVTQVVQNIDLAGPAIPAPGTPLAIDGAVAATLQGLDGPVVVSPGAFGNNYTYGVQALVAASPQVAQEFVSPGAPKAPAIDLQIPGAVPEKIAALAASLVTSHMNESEKAIAIQDYLLSDAFRYQLPTSVSATQTSGYAALSSFLFTTRTGYCQQFASAFAVLARIDGLPTRVVVGFLAPATIKHDSWVVTGLEVHAWPQVYFPGTGWVDFEPTPGAGSPPYPPISTTTIAGATTTTLAPVTNSSSPTHNFQPPPGGGGTQPIPFPTAPPAPAGGGSSPGRGGAGGVGIFLLALVTAALLWALVVPSWRLLRERRRRDPVGAVLLAWREAVNVLAAAGLHRRRAETFQEFATRVRVSGVLTMEADAAFDRLAQTANQALFAPMPPTPEQSRAAGADSAAVRRSARRSMGWWAKILLQLDPRDLLVPA
jgi:transglutaminase-like putative cysteine protease